ncbi:MAG: tetratricopeptide repeat protein [Methylobacterium sp.]|nr:tetratricopeptide repeat protein [Methylobacterium sp.]MCA3615033.1 tetratricopeptide repeat protein [Methylobacterium sp.]MCA4910627.1 tetratricopeptide repeat protein [Methylobacterium sp.]
MKSAVMFAKAVACQINGKPDEAKELYKKLLRYYPESSEVLGNLAVLVKKDGHVRLAEQMLRRAVNANPQNFSALTTLANIKIADRKYAEARKFNDMARAIAPEDLDAIVNEGVLFIHDNKLDEAEFNFWQVMQRDPKHITARMNFANIRRLKKDNIDNSITMLKQVAEQDPDNIMVNLMIAAANQDAQRYVEALHYAEKALAASNGQSVDALNAIATCLIVLGELEEAVEIFQRSQAISPDNVLTGTAYLFALNYDDRRTPKEVFHEYQRLAHLLGKDKVQYNHSKRGKIEGRRIRIGYVSPDFYTHVVSFFIEPILRNHNRTRFEVIAYANVMKPDEHTVYLKRYFDKWVDVVRMNDEEMAAQIRADDVDILIDLAGHTHGNRLPVLAMKPAPIQATYLGFGYTTGFDQVDYFIGDNNLTPPGEEAYFSEKVLNIEAPLFAYNPPWHRAPEITPPPALTKGYVTFGSMTRMVRLNTRLLRVWKQILDRVPGSKLRFDQKTMDDPETVERFYRRLEGLGFERARVELVSTPEHWNGYLEFDIALDCWPHNGGTTTFEALFSGVPVVGKRDRVSVGRLADTVLKPLGLEEWIADTPEEFVELAVKLASDLPRLADIRANLRKRMTESAFFDFKARTRGLEAGYYEMVRRYNEERA